MSQAEDCDAACGQFADGSVAAKPDSRVIVVGKNTPSGAVRPQRGEVRREISLLSRSPGGTPQTSLGGGVNRITSRGDPLASIDATCAIQRCQGKSILTFYAVIKANGASDPECAVGGLRDLVEVIGREAIGDGKFFEVIAIETV